MMLRIRILHAFITRLCRIIVRLSKGCGDSLGPKLVTRLDEALAGVPVLKS